MTLDGGHGGKNTLQAGAGTTREHGWFGQNTLIGGTGPNQLVGRAGHVKFKPTATTNEIFAGVPHPGYHNYHFYNGRVSYQIQPARRHLLQVRQRPHHPDPDAQGPEIKRDLQGVTHLPGRHSSQSQGARPRHPVSVVRLLRSFTRHFWQ